MEGDHQGESAKKPRHLTAHNAAAFRLDGVAEHYPLRPPYPQALVDRLRTKGRVLEMGCGTAELSRRLAPFAREIVAVDPSAAMLEKARTLPGGDAANITWILSTAEEFEYRARFDLVLTPQSLHWMDWEFVLPAFGHVLDGELAIIPSGRMEVPWRAELKRIVPEYSTMWNYEEYDLIDTLEDRALFSCRERTTLGPEPFRQTVDDYVGSWWSRASFARVDEKTARAFESRVRKLVAPHARDGWIEGRLFADLALGRPVRR